VFSGEIPHYVIARGALRHIKAKEQQRERERVRERSEIRGALYRV